MKRFFDQMFFAPEDGGGTDHFTQHDDPSEPGPGPSARGAFGPALGFRAWDESDLAVFRSLLDDPDVWTYLPEDYPAPLTEQLAADLIAISGLEIHHEVRAVTLGGVPVGQVRLQWDVTREPGTPSHTAEIGYWLGRKYWGQGLGRVILERVVPDSFARHPDLQSLWAQVHPDNPASMRVLERAGFTVDAEAGHPEGWHVLRCARPGGAPA